MKSERLFTPSLTVFLAVVGVVLALAGFARLGQGSLETAVTRLSVGDLEREERRQLLEQVLTSERGQGDPVRSYRIMAAVALGDRQALRQALPAGGLPGWAEQVAAFDDGQLSRISLGDPVLEALLAALLAEARGQEDAANRYSQVQASSSLFHMNLAQELAGEGLARLR